jgi:MoaA/NifB/PqqE/SkfB family radical SAM enzyme
VIKYQEITQVDLELSTLCNASCPDCPRNLRGYDFEDPLYVLRSLSLEEVQTLLPKKFIEQLKHFMIIGNYGDFITCRDGLKIVQYLHDCNPTMFIYISTNASGQPNIWDKLALIPTLRVGFRIDGLRDTHSIYRQYTDYDLIIKNAQKFIASGGNAHWEMIKFDFNSHQIDQARELAKQLGFKYFNLIDQGRNKMPVFTREGKFLRNIGVPEHNHTLQELIDARHSSIVNHIEFQQKHRENTVSKNINCKAKKNKSIYISVTGQVYPCCWTAFFPELDIISPGNDQIKELSVGNNAFDVGIENAVNWFSKLEQTWDIPLATQGRPIICNENCGTSVFIP